MAILHLGSPWPLQRKAKQAASQRADELLDAVGLGGLEQRKVGELSGGQQARVNLARALMNSPQLLLVDEPTAALDTTTATQVTELIRQMARESNAATLYVSHDQDQLATLDRVLTLVDGAITESRETWIRLRPGLRTQAGPIVVITEGNLSGRPSPPQKHLPRPPCPGPRRGGEPPRWGSRRSGARARS